MGESVTVLAAHQMQCWCGDVVDVQIPVLVTLRQGPPGDWRVVATVDDSQDWEQPLWDHQLERHGPADG